MISQHIEWTQPAKENLLIFYAKVVRYTALIFWLKELKKTDKATERHELDCGPNWNFFLILIYKVENKVLFPFSGVFLVNVIFVTPNFVASQLLVFWRFS